MSAPPGPDELISAHLDGGLDDAGHRALEDWLLADRAHQRRFLLAVMDHRAMAGALAARPRLTVRTARRMRRRRGLRLASWSGAALAAALLVGLAVLLWPAAAAPGPRLLVAGAGTPAQRLGQGAEVAVDPGRGAALLYDDGTRVELDAGSALTVSGTHVTLRHGHLAADVAHQSAGRPFVIATPNATVTVLGTALDVATDGSESVVAVTRGRVAVERGGDAARIEVGAGERSVVAAGEALLARPAAAPDGRLLRVGAGQAYATLADLPALAPGDVVELQPGTHRGAWRLPAAGTALRPVTIRGAAGEPPLITAAGLALSGAGPVPRAALQLEGGHWRIQHLAISDARNGENAAGIRLVEALSATLSDCRIARCDQGIDALAGRVTIEDCDIGACGAPGASASGHCRALSLLAGQALVRGCLLHDQMYGQALRSTCGRLELEANRIVGSADGEISIATGAQPSTAILSGNLIVSRAGRPENTVRFIQVEGEGDGVLQLLGNTCVAGDPRIVFIIPGRLAVAADGNIFTGSGRVAEAGNVVGLRNWLPTGAAVPPGFRDSRGGAAPGFRAPAQGDYGLAPDSPCRNAGRDMWSRDADAPHAPGTVGGRLPTRMPAATMQAGSRARTALTDQGAFEDG